MKVHKTSLLFLCSCLLVSCAEGQSTASDESAIRQTLADYAAARQRQDVLAQAQFYAADADFRSNFAETISRGREEIEVSLQPTIPASEYRFTLDVEQIRFLSSNIALVDATYGGNFTGFALYVMVKPSDRWLIGAARVAGWR